MIGARLLLRGRLVVLWAVLTFTCILGLGAESFAGAEGALLAKHQAIKPKLDNNQFGAPIYLESVEADGSVRVDMYGVFNYPFPAVRDALQSPANWCDITSLHINIKACTYSRQADRSFLTMYSGRKYYQPPSDAYPLKFSFRIVSQQPEYLDVALAADEGPLRTKNHRIRLEAAPLDKGRTFMHFSYVYSHGAVARTAIKGYFATLARDKVGFSKIGRGGKTVYIDGVRGSIERNTVRYYLALQTFMDTLQYPEERRFEQQISRWYDLTARYPRQLKEMEKADYLTSKRQERKNQVTMQRKEGR